MTAEAEQGGKQQSELTECTLLPSCRRLLCPLIASSLYSELLDHCQHGIELRCSDSWLARCSTCPALFAAQLASLGAGGTCA